MDGDGDAVMLADELDDATPLKSTTVLPIGGNGELAYPLPNPTAHTTLLTPVNEICAPLASPLCACRLHDITLVDAVWYQLMLPTPAVSCATICDPAYPNMSYWPMLDFAKSTIMTLLLAPAGPCIMPLLEKPTLNLRTTQHSNRINRPTP